MPDLSHRPTRYAVTAIAAVALVAGTLTSIDVRVGQDAELARAQRVAADLQEQIDRSEAEASTAATSASPSSPEPTGRPSSTGGALATAGPPTTTATTVIRQVVAGTRGGSGAGTSAERPSTAPPTSAGSTKTAPAASSCLSQPDQESAQAVFSSDRTRYAAWDGDGDGLACEQLKQRASTPVVEVIGEPEAPVEEEPPVPTSPELPDAPAAGEIVAAGQFFGLATATTQETDDLEAALGRQVTMTSFYKGWDTGYDADRVTAAWERGQVPVMTWESRSLETTGDTTDYSLARIAGGDFDDYLLGYAREVDALGLPVVIRFDHEMNGDWYRWTEALDKVGGKNAYGNAPGSYVAAWRHVHDVFKAAGAGDEVIWNWSPNRVDNITSARFSPLSAFYPGDEYVDWVGMTGYYRPEDVTRKQAPTFAGTFDKTLGQLRAVAPGKPILISEMGATEDGNNKLAWTSSFFTGLAAQPDVVGFTWFNYAISEKGHTNDWRIDSTPTVFAAAKTGLAAAQFGLDVGKRFTLKPVAATAPTAVPSSTPSTSAPSTTTGTTATPATTPATAAPSSSPSRTTTGTATRSTGTSSTGTPSTAAPPSVTPRSTATTTPTTAP